MLAECSAVLTAWRDAAREFYHAPIDVRTVAALRIGYAGLMLVNVLCWWPISTVGFPTTVS